MKKERCTMVKMTMNSAAAFILQTHIALGQHFKLGPHNKTVWPGLVKKQSGVPVGELPLLFVQISHRLLLDLNPSTFLHRSQLRNKSLSGHSYLLHSYRGSRRRKGSS
ncbi:hypothetical protein K1719_010685 [Acacia pycnantha]|nr:hypothetical protein K1719_010685 [Acacia pycnantha]